jgi:hypothetical protein
MMNKKPSYVIELRKIVIDETGLHDAEKSSFEIDEQKYNSCTDCASHSASSDKVPEPIGMNSTDIMLLAHDEWKRREERKHNHPEEHWVPGFINGFLTDKKWGREYVKKIRQQTKEP